MIRTNITGIGDPFILKHGDTYYMYATSAPDGFLYFTSDNLIDWKEGEYCYRNSPWGENNFWAPEVYERDGKFYMNFHGTLEGKAQFADWACGGGQPRRTVSGYS